MDKNTCPLPEEYLDRHRDLLARYKEAHVKVRIWHNEKQPNDIAYFTVEGDGWEERINTLSGLYGWLNGYTRAIAQREME